MESSLSFIDTYPVLDYEQSLFLLWSVEQNARDTQMTTRVTPLTKLEEKERLLAV